MAKIIVIRGNSGSGKTTVAKALREKFGREAMRISQDVVRREILHVQDKPGNLAEKLMIGMLHFGRENCKIVILEGILDAEYYQKLFTEVQTIFSDEIYAYYFDLPFAETLRRHVGKPNADEFGELEMRRWWKEKDFLRSIQEEILTADMQEAEIIERIYRDVIANNK